MSEQICLTIDGQPVQCAAGSTIYQAATAAGIHIPTFCHHRKLTPVGACRTCLVEVEGVRGLQASCSEPAREGMVVRVHTSPAAVKARRAVIEFLLANHPLDCPVCDKGGECPLQNQAMADGPGTSRYIEEKRHKRKRHPLGELIVLDQERCVLCWRCVRFLDEWADDHELDLFGRGAATCLDTFPGRPLTSKWQGNTIELCPVGALTSRVFRFEARVWELTDTPSICPLCAVGCNITLGVKNNELRRVTPRENPHVNDAWICDRGRFAHGFVDHPERLTTPLIRRKGELLPASWQDALDLVAERLRQAVAQRGAQAVAGIASTRIANEANYLFQRMMRSVLGTNNIDHLGRFPEGAVPLASLPDLEHRDAFLLLGFDPSTEAPLVELWLKKAVLRHGARVVVANPWRIELARYGGPWLGYRPGSEVALLDRLTKAIAQSAPGSRCAANEIEAARVLVEAKRPLILYGPRWLDGRPMQHGTPRVLGERLGSAEPARRANADSPAGGALEAVGNLAVTLRGCQTAFVAEDNNTLGALEMGAVPDLLPGRQPFDDRNRNRMAGLWGGRLSPLEGLDVPGMLAAAVDDRLEVLWVVGADPASECRTAGEALGRVPFLVAQDLFLTETASMAEVVLPAASFAETDGTWLNLTGRLQATRAAMRPPGQARPDWWIIVEAAKRLVDGRRQRVWQFNGPSDVLNEVAKVIPNWRGVEWTTIAEEGWQQEQQAPASRRTLVRVGAEPTPADPAYPLVLAAGRLLYDRGTLLSRGGRTATLAPEAYLALHSDDAQALGLKDGDMVVAVSEAGSLEFSLRVSDEITPGVAFVPLNLTSAPLGTLLSGCRGPTRVRVFK